MGRLVALAGLLVALGGCGVADDRTHAGNVTARFFADLRTGHAAAACGLLSSALRQQVEKQGPCPRELASLKLSGRGPARVEVFITQAKVDVRGGDTVFLGRDREGWRLDAVGCKPQKPDEPFDCEEES